MNIIKSINENFCQGLKILGFDENDDSLFLTNENKRQPDPQIEFHIETARDFQASAVYLRKQLNGSYKPQVFLFDYTDRGFDDENEIQLTEIQKKIWSSGEAPIACIFYNTEIKIIDCTTHIHDNDTPAYLIKHLSITKKAHYLYNEQFAIKIKSGVFWEEEELKNVFKFQNSSYDKLIQNIRYIVNSLNQKYKNVPAELINKLIVQSILIKYLEERIDDKGNKLLSDKYFKKYDGAITFNDVLKKGKFVALLTDLNDPEKGFNGNVFEWNDEERVILENIDLTLLAELLETNQSVIHAPELDLFPGWRYFEFKYIPVELISRLYEEFLGEDKKEKGLFYTPSHLAKLLIDECIPLKHYKTFSLDNYHILDPACGSGIFLVLAFKRLVQIWRLQNDMKSPDLNVLKKLLLNIYGVDKEEQAVRLASFSLSLALCHELKPLDIINNLKFDDLRVANLIKSDFFIKHALQDKKFNLIVGNPPFVRGGINEYSEFWEYANQKVVIPQGQIALKFLSESLFYLKTNGLLCLIIKSSGLLYNSTSENYKKLLFSELNVIQVLDFTALARNNSLWDNEADVASAAIFIRNEVPDFTKNVLHLTFRRTKATRERIVFEIDDYDLHFINRQTAIDNPFIWKNNLLGGGRIKTIVDSFRKHLKFETLLSENNCLVGEGYIIGTNGDLNPSHIFDIPTLPTKAINESGIDYSQLHELDKDTKFVKVPVDVVFKAPNIIIWENIGKENLPVFYNEKPFSFKHKIIGIGSQDSNSEFLKSVVSSFKKYSNFYRFYIFATSSQILVNLNTAILKTDIMHLPFIGLDGSELSDSDYKIIEDVNHYFQDFIRHGEHSIAVKKIGDDLSSIIKNYGSEFSETLNLLYEEKGRKFRLSDVIKLYNNSFIATVFKYDSSDDDTIFHESNDNFDLKGLSDFELSKSLTINRIIKLYPQKDTIVFIKPNQYRYWLSLTAYRDADKCFYDLSKAGY